jgi:hypothetical protein
MKPIQILSFDNRLVTLCDDGSIWVLGERLWTRIPDVVPPPQPETAQEKQGSLVNLAKALGRNTKK